MEFVITDRTIIFVLVMVMICAVIGMISSYYENKKTQAMQQMKDEVIAIRHEAEMEKTRMERDRELDEMKREIESLKKELDSKKN